MTKSLDKKEPLESPTSDKKREAARAIVEGVASIIPGGGLVTRVLRTTHPPKSEHDRKTWQSKITELANEQSAQLDRHERVIFPKRILRGVPAQVLEMMVRSCPDGLGQQFHTVESIGSVLAGVEVQAVSEAIFDLEHQGLVRIFRTLSTWRARLEVQTYQQVDHQIMGWSPAEDAKVIAQLMLVQKEGRATLLHEASGWEKRRFNPALQFLLDHIPRGRVSREIQPNYVTSGVSLIDEDYAALRRFVSYDEGE